ncbi:NADH-quinone oxidoreductase subunit NuoN [Rubeoparvulum massiliense]|uniref:NADH-quinone oxidoreductase subunit NuoN n=1 Tax=Rubeoparvulum massiliense TaxID=1631346 RepID=UPI00065E7844|nr:NADH-quinone oxidoreductase subunit NuoN [Rubeoparvulum massiliense]
MLTDQLFQYEWSIMAPELTIVIAAFLITLIDLFLRTNRSRRFLGWLALAAVVMAGYFLYQDLGTAPKELFNEMYRLDSFAIAFKFLFLIGTAIMFILSLQAIERREIVYQGEYYTLVLTGLLGAMMMASSADIITLFIAMELLSISSYILVGIRKKNQLSNEAAFKYFVNGGIASAIMLFGFSYLYGLTGTTNLYGMWEHLNIAFDQGYDLLVYLSFILILVGLSFKISVVPFQMWAPDVYQGAFTPVTAFLSVVSKAAGFAMILRIFLVGYLDFTFTEQGQMRSVLYVDLTLLVGMIAAITMIVGNTMAIRQVNVKRMMAYSSIAQAGYLLVPFVAFSQLFFDQLFFYFIAYLFANLGVFTMITLLTKEQGTEDLKAFAGLYHRSPMLAVAMTIFLMSLASIPITAGFFGKFYLLMAALGHELYWLVAIMLATTVVSYFYYFSIVRQMYMRPGETEERVITPIPIAFVLLVTFIVTIGLGLMPNFAIDFIHENFNVFNDLFSIP